MEERMTVCNMSIEGGARAGMIAADKNTVEYLRGRRYLPSGKEFDELAARWLECRSDDGAKFDRSVVFDAATFAPQVTWGTNPGMVTDVTGKRADPARDRRHGSSARRSSGRSTTWRFGPARESRTSRSIACSSDRAPTRG